MPNFDQFERKLRASLVEMSRASKYDASAVINKFAKQLNFEEQSNRPMIFKEKTIDDFEKYLLRVHCFFLGMFPDGFCFSTSQDNRKGKDLKEEYSGAEIEIKTGTNKTDANLGLMTVGYILSSPKFSYENIKSVLK